MQTMSPQGEHVVAPHGKEVEGMDKQVRAVAAVVRAAKAHAASIRRAKLGDYGRSGSCSCWVILWLRGSNLKRRVRVLEEKVEQLLPTRGGRGGGD